MIKLNIFTSLFFIGGLFLVGCASNPPVDKALIMSAEQKVQQAKDDQAYEYAPLEIRTAEKYLADAKAENSREETVKATTSFELAVTHAEHALAKTRAEKAEKAAEEINSGLNSLRNESTK